MINTLDNTLKQLKYVQYWVIISPDADIKFSSELLEEKNQHFMTLFMQLLELYNKQRLNEKLNFNSIQWHFERNILYVITIQDFTFFIMYETLINIESIHNAIVLTLENQRHK